MKVGDLVKNLNSESGMIGIIVGWIEGPLGKEPRVLWADGRCRWIKHHLIEGVK